MVTVIEGSKLTERSVGAGQRFARPNDGEARVVRAEHQVVASGRRWPVERVARERDGESRLALRRIDGRGDALHRVETPGAALGKRRDASPPGSRKFFTPTKERAEKEGRRVERPDSARARISPNRSSVFSRHVALRGAPHGGPARGKVRALKTRRRVTPRKENSAAGTGQTGPGANYFRRVHVLSERAHVALMSFSRAPRPRWTLALGVQRKQTRERRDKKGRARRFVDDQEQQTELYDWPPVGT